MIARDADTRALKLDSSPYEFHSTSFGDELQLPSVGCDLPDLNITSNDFELLLSQSLKDVPLSLDGLSMDCYVLGQSEIGASAVQPICELTNMFLEDTKRPRDVNISLPTETNLLTSFFQSLNEKAIESEAIDNNSNGGMTTPPFSGGSTPQTQSRAASPAWSESSGNLSASSITGLSCPRKSFESNPVPRHKRPSHRRAEVKRRDKIKTCLDDIKVQIPSLHNKGKLSESTVLCKAAEYIHQLKDGFSERGNKTAELRREIQCLSKEIHSFQEALPAGGLKEDTPTHAGLDELYTKWLAEHSKKTTKHYIFSSITSSLFDSFKEVVGDANTQDSLASRLKEWQTKYLSLPVLRKQILSGMLKLTRSNSVVSFSIQDLSVESCVDGKS